LKNKGNIKLSRKSQESLRSWVRRKIWNYY